MTTFKTKDGVEFQVGEEVTLWWANFDPHPGYDVDLPTEIVGTLTEEGRIPVGKYFKYDIRCAFSTRESAVAHFRSQLQAYRLQVETDIKFWEAKL